MTSESSPPEFDEAFRAKLLELFRWRRDVRSFRPDPIPEGLLEELIATASLAPSVGLSEPWRFVIVDDPARRAAIRACFQRCNQEALAGHTGERAALYARLKLSGLDDAPCQFALFAEPNPTQGHGLGRATMPETVTWSAVLAAHTLWLTARTHGLGLGWVSILDPAAVSEILDIPPEWHLIGYFCLGTARTAAPTPELEIEGWEQTNVAQAFRR